jgi:hypothetical protein
LPAAEALKVAEMSTAQSLIIPGVCGGAGETSIEIEQENFD